MRESLAAYRGVLEAWESWSPSGVEPLDLPAEACRARWARGLPLLADQGAPLPPSAVEDLLGAAMELVAAAGEWGPGLQRMAEAWDQGEVSPAALLPAQGRLVSADAEQATGLPADVLGFLAIAALRPALERLLAGCRPHLTPDDWRLGVCPFCGAPPGFVDVIEDGRRRPACHLCGGAWHFPKIQCLFCGADQTRDLLRLEAEGRDQGYFVAACRRCRGYVKELDRRARWDGGVAIVEDWGSPHLDLVAGRQGYWRPSPSFLLLPRAA
jgi:FdhE protein